jgi:hypothetical protein
VSAHHCDDRVDLPVSNRPEVPLVSASQMIVCPLSMGTVNA